MKIKRPDTEKEAEITKGRQKMCIVITQVGSMVLQCLWKLILVRRFWWNDFTMFSFFQHGSIPLKSTHCSKENPILKENLE